MDFKERMWVPWDSKSANFPKDNRDKLDGNQSQRGRLDKIKKEYQAWVVAQWLRTCLACTRPGASPALCVLGEGSEGM
jgi:hypothetical protein